MFVYKSREHGSVNLNNLLRSVAKVKDIEKVLAEENPKRAMKYSKKWCKIEDKLPF